VGSGICQHHFRRGFVKPVGDHPQGLWIVKTTVFCGVLLHVAIADARRHESHLSRDFVKPRLETLETFENAMFELYGRGIPNTGVRR
jgi:hypothetical protein